MTMAISNLPRPWMLAALANVPVTELARDDDPEASIEPRVGTLPRADERRARLASWRPRRAHAPDGLLQHRRPGDRLN
jgi:hypothetical protein